MLFTIVIVGNELHYILSVGDGSYNTTVTEAEIKILKGGEVLGKGFTVAAFEEDNKAIDYP